MAKLFSVSCGPLPILFLLFLASAPVMASALGLGQVWEGAKLIPRAEPAMAEHSGEWAKKLIPRAEPTVPVYSGGLPKKLSPWVEPAVPEYSGGMPKKLSPWVEPAVLEYSGGLPNKLPPVEAAVPERFFGLAEKLSPDILRAMKAPKDFIKGWKRGLKTCKRVKKISGLIDHQNPGPEGSAAPYAVVSVSVIPIGGTSPIPLPVLTADITDAPQALCGVDVEVGVGNGGGPPAPPQAPSWLVVGFGNGGELSRSYPRFSYQVRIDGTALVWLPTAPPQQQQGRHLGGWISQATTTIPLFTKPMYPADGRYYVGVIGIRVGEEFVLVRTSTELGFRPDGTGGVYLSTTEPYTYLESGVYLRLRAKLISQIEVRNPGATPTSLDPAGKLCYLRAELTVPTMAILFAGGNAVKKLELAAANVWYREGPYTVCLAILPTDLRLPGQASILGSWLQTGRMMTIDVTQRTLTF